MKKSVFVTIIIFTLACTAAIVKCQSGDFNQESGRPAACDPGIFQNEYNCTHLVGYAVLVNY